jgi:4-hydroxybenzoate polyprenyltransferase
MMRIKAYLRLMRVHKPIGILLLLWPTLWALWLAAQGLPDHKLLIIFVLGVVIMRSAGCVINDIADREFDKHVKRTAMRPITAGEVSVKSAVILLMLLLGIAFVLVLQLNLLTIKLSLIAMLLAGLYPFTKRWTYWPQLFLGAAFAMPVPMAFAAQLNHLPMSCWIIYSIAVLWPMMYDTEYAMVDRDEDINIGLKSTAIKFGKYDVLAVALMQFIIVILWIILGTLQNLTVGYFIAVFIATSLFMKQLSLIHDRNPQQCFKAFINNQWVGFIIFLGIAIPLHVLY